MPLWLESIVDEPSHPDIPWRPPLRLPSPADLRAAIRTLEQSPPATPAFAKQCIAKLMVAFEPNTKLSADETRLRAQVWIEANGDLSDALWAEATSAAIQMLKWMPKPSEFRDLVADKLESTKRRVARLNEMLAAHARQERPYVREPEDVRLRAAVETFRKLGKPEKVAEYEARLAAHLRRPAKDESEMVF